MPLNNTQGVVLILIGILGSSRGPFSDRLCGGRRPLPFGQRLFVLLLLFRRRKRRTRHAVLLERLPTEIRGFER